jgi:hypothetical protein
MARHLAATSSGGRATFLLEVALDRARMKTRLAGVLAEERARRGGGDARRYPQPQMAQLLGYSLRQYQRLEDPEDPSLPGWNDLERIMEILELDASAIFGDRDEAVDVATPGDVVDLRELRDELARHHDEVIERLDRIEELARSNAIAAASLIEPL